MPAEDGLQKRHSEIGIYKIQKIKNNRDRRLIQHSKMEAYRWPRIMKARKIF
jgi:hypothetical protein